MALTGRSVLLVLLGLVPIAAAPAAATVRWWTLLCVLLVALDVALAPSPRRIHVLRESLRPVHRDASTSTRLWVRNDTGRRVRLSLRDAWVPSAGSVGERHRFALAPGADRDVLTWLTPVRRGARRADRVTLRLRGPLGLASRQRSVEVPGELRVLPAFRSRRHLPRLLAELHLLEGGTAVRTRGQGTEFDSLRDYVAGDDVRSIDWRATARRGDVVVRTWRPERDRHVVVVLDTSRTSAGRVDDEPRLDAAMDAGLLLTALAAQAGDRVDLVAGDRVIRARVAGAPRERVLHEMITAMTPLEPALVEAEWTTLVGEVGRLARRRSLVVLLTPLEPIVVQESLLPALAALTGRHRVLLASVRDPALGRLAGHGEDAGEPGGAADVYTAAAAEHAVAERRRTAAVLSRLGVEIVDEDPEVLPAALCERYLALKSAGRL